MSSNAAASGTGTMPVKVKGLSPRKIALLKAAEKTAKEANAAERAFRTYNPSTSMLFNTKYLEAAEKFLKANAKATADAANMEELMSAKAAMNAKAVAGIRHDRKTRKHRNTRRARTYRK